MKKYISILMVVLLSTFLVGCKSDKKEFQSINGYNRNSTFNQETYVWEQLYFPTNRTSGVK